MAESFLYHLLPCPTKAITGYDCPGCGMQRSIIDLFNGNIAESLSHYPALFPLITMFIFLILHLRFDFKYGQQFLKFFYIFNTSIILISYFCKLINFDIL